LPPGTALGAGLGSPPQGEAAAVDTVLATNATGTATWVTIYQGTSAPFGVCLPPKAERGLFLTRGVPTRIRAESTSDLACEQRDDGCDVSIELRPGMSSMELRGAGKACQWQATSEPLLGRIQPAVFRSVNATKYWMWLTEYVKAGDPVFGFPVVDKPIGTACIPPGGSNDNVVYRFDMPRDINGGRRFWSWYRMELTAGANCAHPVVCDTDVVSIEWYRGREPMTLHGRYDPAGDPYAVPYARRACWWAPTPD
jgi:hypothetical protein